MENLTLWQLINETWHRMAKQFEPVIENEAQKIGIDLRVWGLLLAVMTFRPDNTTPAHLMVRSPYTAVESFLSRLNEAKDLGLLEELEAGKFRLTAKGEQVTSRLISVGRRKMDEMDKLAEDESTQLVVFFRRLVKNCISTPHPPDTWSIRHSCKLLPSEKPPMPYIEQSMTALAAYRDDSHLAAWRHTGLSAAALETLTLFWHGEVTSVDTLCEKLEHRGHACKVYQKSTHDLKARGYLKGPHDNLRMTETGRFFRNRVEDDTNNLFFSPWYCLDEADKSRMADLLNLVNHKLSQETA